VTFEASNARVAALVAPRNVVIVGASDRPGNWALRAWRNLQRYKFPGPIFLINPKRDEILGEKCYPDFAALPEPPDHILVVTPASAVADVLESGAAAGARSATIFSSGFGEAYDEAGAALGVRLREVIARTRSAVRIACSWSVSGSTSKNSSPP
jgi:acetyltransferase